MEQKGIAGENRIFADGDLLVIRRRVGSWLWGWIFMRIILLSIEWNSSLFVLI